MKSFDQYLSEAKPKLPKQFGFPRHKVIDFKSIVVIDDDESFFGGVWLVDMLRDNVVVFWSDDLGAEPRVYSGSKAKDIFKKLDDGMSLDSIWKMFPKL